MNLQQLGFLGFETDTGSLGRKRIDAEGVEERLTQMIPGPPSCNTGGKLAWDRRQIGIDWFRVAFRQGEGDRARLIALFDLNFGVHEETRGRHSYQAGYKWSCGAMIWYAAPGERISAHDCSFCVELPGGALATFDGHSRLDFCRDVSIGGRVRRLDVALDFFGNDGVGLIEALLDSCIKGELCGYRSWSPQLHFGEGNQITGYGVVLGGRQSERNATIYDKGLESKNAEIGRHVRWETRWHKEAAEVAARELFMDDRYYERLFNMTCGSCSFREVSSSADQHLNRRSIVDWWQQLTEGGTPVPCVSSKPRQTLERFTNWVNNSVVPTLRALATYRLDAFAWAKKRIDDVPDVSVVLDYLVQGLPQLTADLRAKKHILHDFDEQLKLKPIEVPF